MQNKNSNELDSFTDNIIYSPYYYLRKYANEKLLKQYYQEELENKTNVPNTDMFKVLNGLAFLDYIPFDSEITKLQSYRISFLLSNPVNANNIKEALTENIINLATNKGAHSITSRVSLEDIATIQLFEQKGFISTDNLVTYAMAQNEYSQKITAKKHSIIQYLEKNNQSHIESLKFLAQQSFKNDRFHNDPLISNELADTIYYKWMENALNDSNQTIVIAIDEHNQLPVGFVISTINNIANLKIGIIVLIAVDENYRGLNIGLDMLNESMNFFKYQHVDVIQVGTQISNIPAQKLYTKMGFKPVYYSATLRKQILQYS
jgi:ribosomal protein S18 acetylase RimI-like enzyme